MLDSTSRLLKHDISYALIFWPCRAIRDGQVLPRVVAEEEYCNVEDLRGGIVLIWRQTQVPIATDIECYLKEVYAISVGSIRIGEEYIPPPSGVKGCGASTIANPGVYIWPLMIVKLLCVAT
jgi:hypothetical protein